MEDDLKMLPEDLIGELQATNQYEGQIGSLVNEEAVASLEHTIADQEEHVAEVLKLIAAATQFRLRNSEWKAGRGK